jgi:hypothetical protein
MAGTVFHDSHSPLWKWFLATYLICESKKGMSANQIKRTLGISHKTEVDTSMPIFFPWECLSNEIES